jgi:hypothetical protein
VNRLLRGEYNAPFSEFEYSFDYQILMAVQNGIHPTLPDKEKGLIPQQLHDLVMQCVSHDANSRPSVNQLQQQVQILKEEYQQHKEEWDNMLLKAIQYQTDGKGSTGNQEDSQQRSLTQAQNQSQAGVAATSSPSQTL